MVTNKFIVQIFNDSFFHEKRDYSLYKCKIIILFYAACSSSLGMEDGRIHQHRLQTSSVFKIAHEPHVLKADYGRLNGPYAWCSQEQRHRHRNIGEYFQIDFKKFTKITKVATQVTDIIFRHQSVRWKVHLDQSHKNHVFGKKRKFFYCSSLLIYFYILLLMTRVTRW